MKNQRIWAIICGACRIEFELYTVITRLCELRSEGLIEGIVLSTWKGEVGKVKGLADKLKKLNIHVVQSDPINDGNYINMSYCRQAMQLNAGLKFIPDDVFVLKCRTDFCNNMINAFANDIVNMDLTIPELPYLHIDFCYKIAVHAMSVSAPFTTLDRLFFGYKTDIKKLILFETSAYLNNKLWPDCLFMLSPFSHKYPLIAEYINTVNYWIVDKKWRKSNLFEDKNKKLPSALNKFYALYFLICYSCFACFGSKEIDTDNSFENILNCKVKGTLANWQYFITNDELFEKIVMGDLPKSAIYDGVLHEIIKMISVKNYALTVSISNEDYAELGKWGIEKLGLLPNQWISNRKISDSIIKYDNISVDSVIDILYPDVVKDQNIILTQVINKINYASDYYGTLRQCLPDLKKTNRSLYNKALFTASRYLYQDVLYEIAKGLYNNKYTESEQNEAVVIFDRYTKTEESLLTFPLPVKKTAAVFYWCKYIEKTDQSIPVKFLDRFSDYVGLDKNINEGQLPSDILISRINHWLEEKISEYGTNDKVEFMIDFLIFACDENPFNKNQLLFIKEKSPVKYEEIAKKYNIKD